MCMGIQVMQHELNRGRSGLGLISVAVLISLACRSARSRLSRMSYMRRIWFTKASENYPIRIGGKPYSERWIKGGLGVRDHMAAGQR